MHACMCVTWYILNTFVCTDSECIRVFLVYNVIWRANPMQVHGIFFRILRGYCVVVNFNVKCATGGMKHVLCFKVVCMTVQNICYI